MGENINSWEELRQEIARVDKELAEKDNEIELLKTALSLVGLNSDEYRYYMDEAAEMMREAKS